MGLLDFLGNVGKDVFGGRKGTEAEDIKKEIERELRDNISGLGVMFNNGVVTLQGQAKSMAAKEKAALLAGNVRGVTQVNDDRLTVMGQAARPAAAGQAAGAGAAAQGRYYTIESGDTLSKIAKEKYGDADKWQQLFAANREVIQDPDKIYPGQRIRIPQSLDQD